MQSFYICLCLFFSLTEAAYCHGKPDPLAQPNLHPIDTKAPVFVREVENASLYTVGTGEDSFSVVHLWSNDAYTRGYAQGSLMKDDVSSFVTQAYTYFEDTFEKALNGSVPWIPESMAHWVAELGLDAGLDYTYDITKSFTGDYFFQELQGLADGAGIDYIMVRRVHMIGELTKGSCSMYGAWNTATEKGKTLQLRALDWNVDGPFQDYPQVTVYHSNSPDSPNGQSFANVGWSGWIGSISGMSSEQTAISEIGVSYPDASFGNESVHGVSTHLTYLHI